MLCGGCVCVEYKQQCCVHVPGAQDCLSVTCTACRGHPPGQKRAGSQLVLDRCGHCLLGSLSKRKSPGYEEEKGGVCCGCTGEPQRDRVRLDYVGGASKKEASCWMGESSQAFSMRKNPGASLKHNKTQKRGVFPTCHACLPALGSPQSLLPCPSCLFLAT